MAAHIKKSFWRLNSSLKLDLLIKDQQKIGKAQELWQQYHVVQMGTG